MLQLIVLPASKIVKTSDALLVVMVGLLLVLLRQLDGGLRAPLLRLPCGLHVGDGLPGLVPLVARDITLDAEDGDISAQGSGQDERQA